MRRRNSSPSRYRSGMRPFGELSLTGGSFALPPSSMTSIKAAPSFAAPVASSPAPSAVIETPPVAAAPSSLSPTTPGPAVSTRYISPYITGSVALSPDARITAVPVKAMIPAATIGGILGGPAGAVAGGVLASLPQSSGAVLETPVGSGPVPGIAYVNPDIARPLAALSRRLNLAATQREATNEHRTIMSEMEFRREVLRLLMSIQGKLPNGALKSKVSRSIRILVG